MRTATSLGRDLRRKPRARRGIFVPIGRVSAAVIGVAVEASAAVLADYPKERRCYRLQEVVVNGGIG